MHMSDDLFHVLDREEHWTFRKELIVHTDCFA